MKVIVEERPVNVVVEETAEIVNVTIEEPTTQVIEVGISGPQGIPGVSTSADVIVETLNGTPDGALTDFELSEIPVANTLIVFMNGLAQAPGGDYTASGTTVSFIEPPWAGDVLRASYVRGE